MSRLPFRLLAGSFLVCLAALATARPAAAQALTTGAGAFDITSDPFTFYYAYYLPNQQIQALRPRPSDAINEVVQNRQYYAQTQRQGLYNPISPYAEESDPLRPYSAQGKERIAQPFRFSHDTSNADGSGPSLYYHRNTQYFPEHRLGRGPNANIARVSRGRGRTGGMGGGMGGMGGGMGGMGGGMGGLGGFG
jgi:hypothetical protein